MRMVITYATHSSLALRVCELSTSFNTVLTLWQGGSASGKVKSISSMSLPAC